MHLAKEQQEFQNTVSSKVPNFEGELPIVTQVQVLPLNQLPWEYFEILCCRLVIVEPGIEGTPYRYGVQGNDQKGIDIVARKNLDNEIQTWCFQCKKYQTFSKSDLKKAINSLEHKAEKYIICVTDRATADMRDIVRTHNLDIEIWDIEDISTKLKNKRDIVLDFFGLEWVKRFCIPQAPQIIQSLISGKVFDSSGRPIENAEVKAVVNERINSRSYTDMSGRFQLNLTDKAEMVGLIVSKDISSESLSIAKTIIWNDVSNSINLHLTTEGRLQGQVAQYGSSEPIKDAIITVEFLGELIASKCSSLTGEFSIPIPNGDSNTQFNVKIQAKGFISATKKVDLPINRTNLNFLLVRECKRLACETFIVETICDDLKIEFVYIPSGGYFKGSTDNMSEVETSSYYISRFPITSNQYSFYIQHNPSIQLPHSWDSRQPPNGLGDCPVTGVSLDEAQAFCNWLTVITNTEHLLPNEDEWEKAARGVKDSRRFPWGDSEDNINQFCNSAESGHLSITPVYTFPLGKSPFGVWDMSGNVWEWTRTPLGTSYVLKGGSSYDSIDEITCYTRRTALSHRRDKTFGFRIITVVSQ